ncbi:ABC transporter permease [Streptacidiphilus rugosus]|uniref:ABC transporter permease n=1 Tax=Streptacidiphilus rugosus TaxID=405783 RepID=UPI0005601AED|nr:ABC transporter permease [Streptacidiphilus rugosus]
MTAALAVAGATVRRMLRDRTALFFAFLLPVAVIVIIGATVTGFGQFRVGVVQTGGGPLARELVTELHGSSALRVHDYTDEAQARASLRRSELDAVVLVPPGLDSALRGGRNVSVPILVEGNGTAGPAAAAAVSTTVAEQGARIQAARFALSEQGGGFDQRLALARSQQAGAAPITVQQVVVGGGSQFLPAGFSYSTPTMLVLFVFLNALAGGASIVSTRGLGVYARVMATPAGARAVVLGETLAYLALALLQSLVIVLVGAVAFGVHWGDPVAAFALVAVWALVGTGAGVLSGTLFRTPEQASAIGPAVGITLGMLGGCMWPLAIVPAWLRTVGHATPQSWAVDAWTELLSRHGDLLSIARQLAVLAAVAVGLLALATVRLRRRVNG